jgi:phage terminase large subunit-like protein
LKAGLEVHSFSSSNPDRFDDVEEILSYGLEKCMRVNPKQYAAMFSQGKHFTDLQSQEKVKNVVVFFLFLVYLLFCALLFLPF